MIESALLNGLSSAYNWRLRWSSWPKPSPSPRAVLIFQRSPVFEWTCSFLPQQASSSSSSLSSPSSTTMTDRKAVIKNADMSEDMQQDAVDCATQAMEKYNIEKDIAAYIKKVRQDGCLDGSKWSSVSLHHWHMICKFRAFFFLFSDLFLVSVERRFLWSGLFKLLRSINYSPQVPPPPYVDQCSVH